MKALTRKIFLSVFVQICVLNGFAQSLLGLTPVQDSNTHLYGFKNMNGELVINYKYKAIKDCMNDVIGVEGNNDKVGFINNIGIEVIPVDYDFIHPTNNAIIAVKNKRLGILDYEGKIIVPFIYEPVEDVNDCLAHFDDAKLLVFKKNGKCGLMSLESFKEIIPAMYDEFINPEYAHECWKCIDVNKSPSKIIAAKKNGKWGFIDYEGNNVLPFAFEGDTNVWEMRYHSGLCRFVSGYCIVKKNGKYGVIDEKGVEVISSRYSYIWLSDSQEKYQVTKDGKKAIFSLDGKQLTRWYYEIEDLGNNIARFRTEENGKGGLIDLKTGKETVPAKYDGEIHNYGKKLKWISDLKGFVNAETGEEFFNCGYEEADYDYRESGLIPVKKNGKWGYIREDSPCEPYIYCRYEDAEWFEEDGLARVRVDGLWGCINDKGKMVIPAIYESLGSLEYGEYRKFEMSIGSRSPDRYGYVDSAGKEVVEGNNYSDVANVLLNLYHSETKGSDVDDNIYCTKINNYKTFALIIANEDYDDNPAVDFAKNDGVVFKKYCVNTLGIPEKNIRYRENATLNNIRSMVNWIKDMSMVYNGDAKFILYYAGHGISDDRGHDSYLLPSDGLGNDVRTAYRLSELYEELGAIPARQVTVFMDACFSGAKRDGGMLVSARGVAIKSKPVVAKGNTVVFSATQGDEAAYQYKKGKHGMFTYFLLKKLKESKGNVTLQELGTYITTEVKRCSMSENGKIQTPTVQKSLDIQTKLSEMSL